jgi:hypothetical protein
LRTFLTELYFALKVIQKFLLARIGLC